MDRSFLLRTAAELLLAAIFSAALCLLSMALFAVFVRAYAPSDLTIAIVCRLIECTVCFFVCMFAIGRERAFFKGAAAGALSSLATMLLFGAIGGFHLSAFYLLQLLLCAGAGGTGAVCGRKLRKE